ncbi:MAG: glycosyltransferase family 4 protein [Bacillota bacterium]
MRVLMLAWEFPPRSVGGLSRHVFELSRALVAGGYEVEVLTCGGNKMVGREVMDGIGVWRVDPYPGAKERDFIDWVQRLNFALLEKGAAITNRYGKFDIIHAHDWLVTFAARALKYIYTTPLLATIHATEFGRNNGLHTDEQRQISDIEWWLTYEAWQVICCSRYMLEELQHVFRLPPDKLTVIPNGIRIEVAEEEGPPLPENLYDPLARLIFYVGRLVPEKGVQVMLEAAPAIISRFSRARFVIAGTGPFEEYLKTRTREMGLTDKVIFTGYIDERTKNELYRSASVAVFPSLYEPFGIVALEAMVIGTPLVVSSCGGLDEIVDHEVEGLKIYPGDAGSLADQVCRLLEDEQWAASLAERAYAKALKKYSWEKIAEKTSEVYREIVLSPENREWQQNAAKEEVMEKVTLEHREGQEEVPYFV